MQPIEEFEEFDDMQTICEKLGLKYTTVRSGSNSPVEYRLAKKNNELILQGYYSWSQGDICGGDWKDIPTITLGE